MASVAAAVYVLSALVCVSGGCLLLVRSRDAAGRTFAGGLLSLGAAQAAALAYLAYGRAAAVSALGFLELVSISCLLAAVLGLEKNIRERRRLVNALKITLAALCAAFAAALIVRGASYAALPHGETLVLGPLGRAHAVAQLVCCVGFMWVMENILRSSEGAMRRALTYPGIGAVSMAAALCMLAVHRLSTNTISHDILTLGSLMILVGCSLFVFFAVRFRLFDMDVFVSRYVVYHSLTFVGIGAYLVMTGAVIWGIRILGLGSSVVVTGFVGFVAMVMLAVFALSTEIRSRLRFFVNTHFFANKYDYRKEWVELSGYLTISYTERQIVHVTSQVILDSMYIAEMSIWLLKRGVFVRSLSFPAEKGDREVRPDHPLPVYLSVGRHFIRGTPLAADDGSWKALVEEHAGFLDANRIELAVGMFAGSDLIGFIAVGRQRPGTPYGQDDIDLLTAIASQASSALVKAWYAERLAENKELDTYNRMSASLLHDLKNASGHLSLILQNAPRYMDREEFRRDMLDTIQQALARIEKVTSKLAAPAHAEDVRPAAFDARDFLGRLLERLRPRLEGVDLVTEADPSLIVHADMDVLERIMENLVINAVEAVESRGRIVVGACRKGGRVHLWVRDNGKGMTDEFMQERLFRPFQTTKPRGTGLGLWQVKTMAERIGAWVEVERNNEGGMTFTVSVEGRFRGGVTGNE